MPKPKIANDDAAGWRKEARRQRKALEALTTSVRRELAALDRVMTHPSSLERGKQIARVMNALQMANDTARYFALDVDWRKDLKRAEGGAA